MTPSTLIVVSGLGRFRAGTGSRTACSTWTGGASAGRNERVDEHRKDATGMTLVASAGERIAAVAGDAFSRFCRLRQEVLDLQGEIRQCNEFPGFPHLPGNDAAYGYVVDGGNFDGGPLVP